MSDTNQTIVSCGDSVVMSSIGATCRRAGLEVVSLDTNQADPAELLRRLSPDVILYDLAHPPADFVLQSLALDPGRLLIGVDLDRDCMLVLSGQQVSALTTADLLRVIGTWRGSPRPLARWQAQLDRVRQFTFRSFAALRAHPLWQKLDLALNKRGTREEGRSVDQAMNLANKRQISINMDSSRKENAMKNMTRRTRTLLALAGVVIVVVVAGLAVLGPSTGLFGGDVIHISPQNPTIPLYQAIDVSINSVGDCDWSTSIPNVALYLAGCGYRNGPYACDTMYWAVNTKKTKVIAAWPGQTVITAKCALFTRSTTVTVGQPAPLTISPTNPTIAVGGKVKLSTTDASCTWSTASSGISLTGGNVADYVTVTGNVRGMSNVKADCRSGTATATVIVQ